MQTTTSPLPDDQLDAVADLERRVVAADGGRLKLEWATLRGESGRADAVLAWSSSGGLDGFAACYRFGGQQPEVTGMVAPEARGRGLGAALLAALLAAADEDVLLVVPRSSATGHHLARARGGREHHSEHALRLDHPPAPETGGPGVVVRPMRRGEEGLVGALLSAGFGAERSTDDEAWADESPLTRVVVSDDEPVGTLRLQPDGDGLGVYGFVVRPDRQGRGIGRAALASVCAEAFTAGYGHVHLEVETANDRALGLYTSLGFAPVSTEDYWLLPIPPLTRPDRRSARGR